MPNRDELIAQLNWRYATKRFDANKKIASQDLDALMEGARLAASSYGLQPYKIVHVQDKELRKKLRAVSYDQPQIEEADHLFVFAPATQMTENDVKTYVELISKTRDVPMSTLADYQNTMVNDLVKGPRSKAIGSWAQRQTYIAIGFLLTTAAYLKIDACPMEGFEPARYDELLNLKGTGYGALAVVTAGYRSPADDYARAKKVRKPKETLFIEK